MDLIGGITSRSVSGRSESVEYGFDSFHFDDELHRFTALPPDGSNSFTALLELSGTQAVDLLHYPDRGISQSSINGGDDPKHSMHSPSGRMALPPNAAQVEHGSNVNSFLRERNGNVSKDAKSIPNSDQVPKKVKNEPVEAESSQPQISDSKMENHEQNQIRRPNKRKEREKKGKWTTKKSRSVSEEDEKLPYVHVRARRGEATDSHSLAERARREKINARMKLLQELVPGCNKISGTALVLDEIINHVQTLQRQVEILSMRLAAVNPRIDFNLDSILTLECGSVIEGNIPGFVMPICPEFKDDFLRQRYDLPWHLANIQQPIWVRDESCERFLTPETSLLSYDSSASTVHMSLKHVKMDL